MGRPPLPVGTAGKVRFQRLAPRRVRARVNVRDGDGVVREVARYGPTQAMAERRLKEALRDRTGPPAGGEVTADTRLRDAAALWWAEVQESGDLREQTKEVYGRSLRKIVAGLGGLLVREIDVPRCDRFLKAVRTSDGPSAAKTTKTTLGLMLGMVVRHGALDTNPVRETAKISSGPRARPRALSRTEQVWLLEKIRADEQARRQDIADLAEFLDGTGMRIGEALGVRDEVIDLEAGVLEVCATAVWRKGDGTLLQLLPKSEAGWRVLALPTHLVEIVRRRRALAWPAGRPTKVLHPGGRIDVVTDAGLLFPALTGGVRNPANASRDIRKVVDRIDEAYGWVTTHTWRKTVATRLDEAGLSAREIADHIGHAKPSMTQDVYMGRNVASAKAARVLGRDFVRSGLVH